MNPMKYYSGIRTYTYKPTATATDKAIRLVILGIVVALNIWAVAR